jgi:hypothetical protein
LYTKALSAGGDPNTHMSKIIAKKKGIDIKKMRLDIKNVHGFDGMKI